MQRDQQPSEALNQENYHPGRIINESVFISYFIEDSLAAKTVKKQLTERNIDFFDLNDAEHKTGANIFPEYETVLPEILNSCSVFIPLLSYQRLRENVKGPLYKLWNAVSTSGKMKIIPVWIDVKSIEELPAGAALQDLATVLPGIVQSNNRDIFLSDMGLPDEAINIIKAVLPNPFKGPIPYSRKDRIYGRHSDIIALYDYIRQNKLTLLYSKSGNGKTSLIQAGLIPELEKSNIFMPVYIRVTADEINSWSAITELIKKKLKNLRMIQNSCIKSSIIRSLVRRSIHFSNIYILPK